MNIIAISGKAGAGKDTIADYLVREHGYVKIGLADPMKRFCKEIFGFTDEQLWGPSEKRNAEDERWSRHYTDEGDGPLNLTPRYALQTLGTEWGRQCHRDVWIEYALNMSDNVLYDQWAEYDPRCGLRTGSFPNHYKGAVISDARFRNELEAVRAAGGTLWRVVRPDTGGHTHASETEQDAIPDSYFDWVFDNVGSIGGLQRCVQLVLNHPPNRAA